MNASQLSNEFIQDLSALVGLECWSTIGGKNTGSMVTFGFGAQIPRARPLTNPRLTDASRNFTSEYCLFVQMCAWRIDGEEGFVCSWRDDNANDGLMVQGITRLIGSHVLAVSVALPGYDLTVRFDSGLALRFFCDEADPEEPNYLYFLPGFVYTVEGRSVLSREERERKRE